jgi:hypothetical protein
MHLGLLYSAICRRPVDKRSFHLGIRKSVQAVDDTVRFISLAPIHLESTGMVVAGQRYDTRRVVEANDNFFCRQRTSSVIKSTMGDILGIFDSIPCDKISSTVCNQRMS